MISRFAVLALALHVAYAAVWMLLSPHGRDVFERWATGAAMTVAGIFYGMMVVAFLWARKSRLNVAFAIQKLYWALLVWMVAWPLQAGLIVHDVPYRSVSTPFAVWTLPGWVRTYVWVFLTLATMGVATEFYRENFRRPYRPRMRGGS